MRRPGFSLFELLLVIVILSAIMYRIVPLMSDIKARSALRGTRQELTAVFAAARASAVQKGKLSTLTLTSGTAEVRVLNGLSSVPITILGPVRFAASFGSRLSALNGAPTSINYDGRGLITPASAQVLRYRISVGTLADTVCVSGAGIVLARGCAL